VNRRKFLAASGVAGLAPLGVLSATADEGASSGRDYLLIQQYQVDNEQQRGQVDGYLREAAIPALNRLGVQPVGVFYPDEGLSPVYVLLRHKSAEKLLNIQESLLADAAYAQKGTAVLEAVRAAPGFKRLETSLHLAIKGVPELIAPATSPGRVFQLRIYESPSVKTGNKKIEMFNTAELAIFRRVGLNPVFFGQTLVGAKMPNLTYMLTFAGKEEQKAAWDRFRSDPEWLALKARPEYADGTILCGITNLLLKPAEYSQM
jgi:hypothetical protein